MAISRETIQELENCVVWWHENRDRGRDYDTEKAFMHKAMDCAFACLASMLLEIKALDGVPRDRRAMVGNLLWTPSGVSAHTE